MKTVVLCNSLKELPAVLENHSGPIKYLHLLDTRHGIEIRDYLNDMADAEELPRAQLFRERRAGFRKQFVEFMGQVNSNNRSPHWWAMLFTSKNPYATDLARNIFYTILIADLMRREISYLVVITGSVDLAAQIKTWGKNKEVETVDLVRSSRSASQLLKRHTPAGILRAFLRTVVLWALSRSLKPVGNLQDDHLVLATATHPGSFPEPGRFRDAYFGPLVDQIASSDRKALVFALVLERPLEQLRRLKAVKPGVPIIPFDACLSLGSIAASLWHALRLYISPVRVKGPMAIDDIDLSCLIERNIRESRGSGEFFLNLKVYACTKRLAQTVKISRCIYPYENRPWEKMLLQGLRDSSTSTNNPAIFGYQHASITPSHANFVLGPGEAEATPLPDKILTTGVLIKERLEAEDNFPAGKFEVACALRQKPPEIGEPPPKPQTINRVLVALATNLEEYIACLAFLEQAFPKDAGYDVRIRPHPIIPLDQALAIAPLKHPDFYTKSTGSLEADLNWAELVLYASSTVGLEAVSIGIPTMHLDLGDFLDTDPMSGWRGFKWLAKSPGEVVPNIESIDGLSPDRFSSLQQEGREYAVSYLTPATESNMRIFWDTEQAASTKIGSTVQES